MKMKKDDQAFDFKKSNITEGRSYFEKGKLLQRINSRNDHSPPVDGHLMEEQKRIPADYDQLKVMLK